MRKDQSFEVSLMGEYMPVLDRYRLIKSFESEHVKSVEYQIVNLSNDTEKSNAITNWLKYCEQGGEGWVIKICPTLHQNDQKAKNIIPMLKVRGIDYLRLVYGIDYLSDSYFDQIKERAVHRKRELARQQSEIADNILKFFLHGYPHKVCNWVAAFFGTDFQSINATL